MDGECALTCWRTAKLPPPQGTVLQRSGTSVERRGDGFGQSAVTGQSTIYPRGDRVKPDGTIIV